MNDGISDAQLDAMILNSLRTHGRTAVKACLIGIMIALAILIFTASVGKSLLIACICLAVSLFGTWRRYLEPISLVAFLAAVIFWCDQEFVSHAHNAIALLWSTKS